MPSPSAELQTAVYEALIANETVSSLAVNGVFDGQRPTEFAACVTFGPSDYTTDDLNCITARIESLQIDCWTRAARLRPARELADAVKSALHLAELSLTANALAILRVTAVRTFMDRDGITAHGVVTLEAVIEER